ncbi:Poly-beta-1,6-N-acetyl-D-glucosamine synthase [Planctomycetes bacterium Pan216]|uniref:Poly-beta-1,6-N-acetyl-D-glucosamine synthase n=1 Tax=Kolteria novifilia TaxID=2527975 RepID=A0A518BAS6_9BACT|nr:Poly-beta-1,6-N-acetyl-D-glucosamine synthase [Planctomycetes bacterium Pan216]
MIPVHDGWRWLEPCLESVERHRPADSEVIVVDDASTEPIERLVRRRFPRVRVLRLEQNVGFCGAVNRGIESASGEFVELLNSDTLVSAQWTEEALANFADPSVGAVAPRVSRLPLRGRIDSAGDLFWGFGVAKKRGEGDANELYQRREEVFSASGCAAFYRRDVLRRIGGFPSHFGAYLDDIDVGHRLRLAGYRCLFEPESHVYHWVSLSYGRNRRRVLRQTSRNSEHVFWTNLPRKELLARCAPHLAFLVIQLAYKSVRGELGPWLAGKCEAMRDLPTIVRRRQKVQQLRMLAPPSA